MGIGNIVLWNQRIELIQGCTEKMTQSSEMMFRKRDNVSVTRNLKNERAGSTEQRFSSNFSV